MIDSPLAFEIKASLSPDCWNGRWSQVGCFGGAMAVEWEVGEFLHALVRAIKPKVIIETGTHKGFSSLMIGAALKDNGFGHLYSIDCKDYGARAEIVRFGLVDYVTLILENSLKAIPELLKSNPVVDLLWLDADHSTESVIGEFRAGWPGLRSGSYITFHDTLSDPREKEGVRSILAEHPTLEHIHLATARGFDLVRVP